MRRFMRSFGYAFQGICLAVREERNFRFHLCATFYVFLFSFFYEFGRVEYSLLLIVVASELSLELLNSSLERAVANPKPHRYELAGAVKDLAAGAVLVFSVAALGCGLFLFWDVSVFQEILLFFTNRLWAALLLAFSFAVAVWFVFFSFSKSSES